MVRTHTRAKGQGQRRSVQKLEWKQMDGLADGGYCNTFCANTVVITQREIVVI